MADLKNCHQQIAQLPVERVQTLAGVATATRDTKALLDALGELAVARWTALQRIDCVTLGELPLRALTCVHASEGRDAYATVDADGHVFVGRVDALVVHDRGPTVHGYARASDDVVSLVTSSPRWGSGQSVDLWLVCRHWEGRSSEPRAWHGLLTVTQESAPTLVPVLEGPGPLSGPPQPRWKPLAKLKLPPWLLELRCTASPTGDLLARDKEARLAAAAGGPYGAPRRMLACDLAFLVSADGNRRIDVQREEGGDWSISLERPFRTMALSQTVAGTAFLAVLCESGYLGLWSLSEHEPRCLLWEPIQHHATTLAWCSATAGASMPDLLLADMNGHLSRYRYVSAVDHEHAWKFGWAAVARATGQGTVVQQLIELARPLLEVPRGGPANAFRSYLVERIGSGELDGAAVDTLLHVAAPLFRGSAFTEHDEATPRAFDDVLHRLAEPGDHPAEGRSWLPGVARLLKSLYPTAPYSLQARLDLELMHLARRCPSVEGQDPVFDERLLRARDREGDLLRSLETLSPFLLRTRLRAIMLLTDVAHRPVVSERFYPLPVGYDAQLRVVSTHREVIALGREGIFLVDPTRDPPVHAAAAVPWEPVEPLPDMVCPLPFDEPTLALAWRSGRVVIGRSTGGRWSATMDVDVGPRERELRAVATTPWQDGLALLATAWVSSAGTVVRVHAVASDGSAAPLMPDHEMSRLSAEVMEVARTRDEKLGIRVLVAGGGVGAYLLAAHPGGAWDGTERRMTSRVTALAFDEATDPRFAILAEQSGHIWCFDLRRDPSRPNPLQRIQWIESSTSPVVTLRPLRVQGRAQVVALAASGVMALLDPEDGRASWHYTFGRPLAGSTTLSNGAASRLVVATFAGVLATFRTLSPHEMKDARARRDELLGGLPPRAGWTGLESADDPDAWQLTGALLALLDATTSLNGILSSLHSRRVRKLFLREVVSGHLTRLQRDIAAVAPALDDLECEALVQALPDHQPELAQTIFHHLATREESPQAPHALVACLRYLATRCGPFSHAMLLARRPPDRHLGHAWARLVFAKLLIHAIVENAPSPHDDLPVVPTLEGFARLPPELTEAAAVLAGNWHRLPLLHDLGAFVTALKDGTRPYREALERCLARIAPHAAESRVVSTYRCLLTLVLLRPPPSTWRDDRTDRLLAFRDLLNHLEAASPTDPPAVAAVVEGFRPVLPRRPMPPDTARLRERQDWWREALAILDIAPVPQVAGPWGETARAMVATLRPKLLQIAREEYHYTQRVVRGMVALMSLVRSQQHEVKLECRVVIEGERNLRDAWIIVDAGTGIDAERLALAPEGSANRRRDYNQLTPGSHHDFTLVGTATRAQSRMMLRVTVGHGEGQDVTEEWPFELPVPDRVRPSFNEVARELPKFVEYLRARLRATSPHLRVVPTGPRFSQAILHDLAATQSGGSVVDVDALLDAPGSSRSEGPTLASALSAVEGAEAPGATPLILAEGFVAGLLRKGEGEALESFVDHLPRNGIVTVGIGDLARFLDAARSRLGADEAERPSRPSSPPGGVLVEAWHLHPREARELSLRGGAVEVVDELLAWAQRKWQISASNALWVLDRLSFDLDLVFAFDLWTRDHPSESTSIVQDLGHFWDREASRLREHLRALPGWDLMLALLGTTGRVLVKPRDLHPGMQVEDDLTVRPRDGTPRLQLQAGSPLDAAQCKMIRGAYDPGNPVPIRGALLGELGGPQHSPFLLLFHSLPAGEQSLSSKHLQELGIGFENQNIFTTTAPYRSVLRLLAREMRAADGGERSEEGRLHDWLADHEPLLLRLGFARLSSAFPWTEVIQPSQTDRIAALRLISQRWNEVTPAAETPERVRLALLELFRPSPVELLASADAPAGDRERDLALLSGVGHWIYGLGEKGVNGLRAEYVLWCSRGHPPRTDRLSALLAGGDFWLLGPRSDERPRMLALGPGVLRGRNSDRTFVAFDEQSVLRAFLREGTLADGLRYQASRQLGLMSFSPFRTTGPLPPESPAFVGRAEEIEFITQNLSKHSMLVVGGRRMGKTSLLLRLHHMALRQQNLRPIFLDLQGVTTEAEFLNRLVAQAPEALGASSVDGALRFLEEASPGRLPVLFLNEVDRLLRSSPMTLEQCRARCGRNTVRFVMVGYGPSLAALQDPGSALDHWVQGLNGSKAIPLGPLSSRAARDLCDLLEGGMMGLRWRPGDKAPGVAQLIQSSYRISWILQQCCEDIVRTLQKKGRDFICLDDVEGVKRSIEGWLWNYLQTVNMDEMLSPNMLGLVGLPTASSPKPGRNGDGDGGQAPSGLLRAGVMMVLHAVARDRYFLDHPERGRAAVRGNIHLRNPLESALSFDVGQARDVVVRAVVGLALKSERDRVLAWLDRTDLATVFLALSLTPILEMDPRDNSRFGFFAHILPNELQRRRGADDPTLDGEFTDRLQHFLQLLG